MALAVYSRVGSVLRATGADLDDVRALIASRYGLAIDARSLADLARDGRLQRPDIEMLKAVASILDVRVDDLLDVRDLEVGDAVTAPDDDILLDPERDERLRHLRALRDRGDRPLTNLEGDELDALTAATARALIDRHIRELAKHRTVPIETARAWVMDAAEDAARVAAELEADPVRMAAAVKAVREERNARAG